MNEQELKKKLAGFADVLGEEEEPEEELKKPDVDGTLDKINGLLDEQEQEVMVDREYCVCGCPRGHNVGECYIGPFKTRR